MRVTVDIYEGEDQEPILSHTAHGRTRSEALAILTTHSQYDAFLRAGLAHLIEPGVYEGTFQGIPLRTVVREE